MIKIGLVGVGYWGPNIVRSFELTGRARVNWLCDLKKENIDRLAKKYPQVKTTTALNELLADKTLDAIAISTPADSHFEIARKTAEAGKHVLIEKPITINSEEAKELIRMFREKDRILMVGHVFEYNATVHALKDLITSGELGEIHYLGFKRTNLGPVRTDVNALWDLASHDVSIMCYLLDSAPINVTARGQAFLNGSVEDAIFATFTFDGNVLAHVNASWLNPRKVREITVVGSKKMVIWDDLDLQYPIRIYDKRISWPSEIPDNFIDYKTAVVDGGVYIPSVTPNQPLQAECDHFLDCVENSSQPRSDGYNGLRVVLALEAATASMKNCSSLTSIKIPNRNQLSLT